jgi:acyl-[acyl-carrier-protein]-phospholipid O-acyltransferase/long-chain-fatty-acid--[acyl-carrier-protein] ligase
LKDSNLRGIALNVSLYWFIANSIALIVLSFGRELFPDMLEGGATDASSNMMLCVGIGLFAGSSVVSILSRDRIRPNMIPLGAIGLSVGLVGLVMLNPAGMLFKISLGAVGFASGFFLVPLAAMLQDRAHEDERGRVISASNLLNSATGVLSIALFNWLDSLSLSASTQMVVVLVVAVAATVWTFPYLKSEKATVAAE